MDPLFILDVTTLQPNTKHKIIFQKCDDLNIGESFILHNDHDPKPVYHLLKSHRGDKFDWEYLQSGPHVWNIIIKRKR